jgi:GGDEF domain-containing protein
MPDDGLITLSMAIRLATYVGVGALIGFFAAQQRTLVEHLRVLADRDRLTGLPTSRAFEAELTKRLELGAPFALLLADADGLGERDQADDALRGLPALLGRYLDPTDSIARVGPDEFGILASCRSTEEAGALAAVVESALAADGLAVTFGWTVAPQEGRNGLALYRAANERLYARKLIRRNEPTRPALAG